MECRLCTLKEWKNSAVISDISTRITWFTCNGLGLSTRWWRHDVVFLRLGQWSPAAACHPGTWRSPWVCPAAAGLASDRRCASLQPHSAPLGGFSAGTSLAASGAFPGTPWSSQSAPCCASRSGCTGTCGTSPVVSMQRPQKLTAQVPALGSWRTPNKSASGYCNGKWNQS